MAARILYLIKRTPGRRVVSYNRIRIPTFNARTYAAISETRFGQPLPASHPHLFASSKEITPGITAEEYEKRRKDLMDSLPDDSIVVAVAGQVKYMSQNIFYKFRQASELLYLTGMQEPESAIILEKNASQKGYRMTVFCRDNDLEHEKWEGARTGVNSSISIFGADDGHDIRNFTNILKSLTAAYTNIYTDVPSSPSSSSKRRRSIFSHLSAPIQTAVKTDYDALVDTLSSSRRKSLATELWKLRRVKSPAEQALMRRASDISGTAMAKTMRFTTPDRTEWDLQAHFQYSCALGGCRRPAYVPVVASGSNALVIHYTSNEDVLRDGDMVLMDAGGEYNGYCADISRTWPVSGTFTPAQRELYSAVLNVQKACIKLCTESSDNNLHDLHRASVNIMTQELNSIGFNLSGSEIERVLYPHYLSHAIGIDLHESGLDRSESLQSGMVITVEPGVYVPPNPAYPKHFHNMGIRIEDEVLVQKDHSVVLSVNAPKEIADVEGTIQGLLGNGQY